MFPHLIATEKNEIKKSELCEKRFAECSSLPWMPTIVTPTNFDRNIGELYLGRLEQADDPLVVEYLELTHILSIGRSPEYPKHPNVEYAGFDGEQLHLYITLIEATSFIQSAMEKVFLRI